MEPSIVAKEAATEMIVAVEPVEKDAGMITLVRHQVKEKIIMVAAVEPVENTLELLVEKVS